MFDLLSGATWLARDPRPAGGRLIACFATTALSTSASAWGDSRALFVGFKGGDNRASHAHLDLGSFVFDASGQRWAMDVGPDDYNRAGYFTVNRWTFYRCRAEGNNCLLLNPGKGPDQSPQAVAPVTRFGKNDHQSGAVLDLTAAYTSDAKLRATRHCPHRSQTVADPG
ncbi:MAG: heparinase II/III family protein [Polyangiaceae bacterium]